MFTVRKVGRARVIIQFVHENRAEASLLESK
ncbi:hypothetical protein ELI_02545 [Erythrobacter litoralis HTCC2594]|uniref:Uncharacterized protein n=1 Tax=Erythrobacter litoralis (strain HTCC2594) TaxID=314225 RepID=Q2NCJ0_ERYLH|nr:hypothetical protein ELI_02545 [Erythrobacter litoralis HTCC2594]